MTCRFVIAEIHLKEDVTSFRGLRAYQGISYDTEDLIRLPLKQLFKSSYFSNSPGIFLALGN